MEKWRKEIKLLREKVSVSVLTQHSNPETDTAGRLSSFKYKFKIVD